MIKIKKLKYTDSVCEDLNLNQIKQLKNFEYPEDVTEFLEDNGATLLGKGQLSSVYENKNFIIKVFTNTDYDNSVEKSWYKYCRENFRKNPHLPKVGKLIDINDFYIIFIEKLEKVNINDFGSLSENDLKELSDELRENNDVYDLYNFWTNLIGFEIKFRNFLQIIEIVKLIKDISKISTKFDIHSDNFMMRGDTLVLIDPFYDNTINSKYA